MTTNDRELLERAAKAAGHEIARWSDDGESLLLAGVQEPWNPLHDDGDEARLEAALMLDCRWWPDDVTVGTHSEMYADHGFDKQKARRYAGVRAAAAMAGEGE